MITKSHKNDEEEPQHPQEGKVKRKSCKRKTPTKQNKPTKMANILQQFRNLFNGIFCQPTNIYQIPQYITYEDTLHPYHPYHMQRPPFRAQEPIKRTRRTKRVRFAPEVQIYEYERPKIVKKVRFAENDTVQTEEPRRVRFASQTTTRLYMIDEG